MKIFSTLIYLVLFSSKFLFGQNIYECQTIIKIDSLTFEKNKTPHASISKKDSKFKNNATLTIDFKDSSLVFKDNTSNENFFEYSYLGEFTDYNFILILGQDYNKNYYYLINKETYKIDTLIGSPILFKKRILAFEDSYTDGNALIEIWKIEKNQIYRSKSFSLKTRMIYNIQNAYLKEDSLFIKNEYSTNKADYYKIKVK